MLSVAEDQKSYCWIFWRKVDIPIQIGEIITPEELMEIIYKRSLLLEKNIINSTNWEGLLTFVRKLTKIVDLANIRMWWTFRWETHYQDPSLNMPVVDLAREYVRTLAINRRKEENKKQDPYVYKEMWNWDVRDFIETSISISRIANIKVLWIFRWLEMLIDPNNSSGKNMN